MGTPELARLSGSFLDFGWVGKFGRWNFHRFFHTVQLFIRKNPLGNIIILSLLGLSCFITTTRLAPLGKTLHPECQTLSEVAATPPAMLASLIKPHHTCPSSYQTTLGAWGELHALLTGLRASRLSPQRLNREEREEEGDRETSTGKFRGRRVFELTAATKSSSSEPDIYGFIKRVSIQLSLTFFYF